MNIEFLCLSSAFFMEGMLSLMGANRKLSDNFGQFELVLELTGYASLAEKMMSLCNPDVDDFSAGVYDYEVSSRFGAWFGGFVHDHDQVPPTELAANMLYGFFIAYFALAGKGDSSALGTLARAAKDNWLWDQGIKKPRGDCLPQQLPLNEFKQFVHVKRLENHGRGWEVFFRDCSMGFADGEDSEQAIRQTHEREVNNALFANSKGAPEFLKAELPTALVLAEYPELQGKFSEAAALVTA